MKKKMWFLSIFAVLVLLFNGCVSTGPPALSKAPDFTLPDLDGKPLSLSDVKGKVVILDFWATWCPPCRAEIPHFNELYKEYKMSGLEIVGISLDRGGATTLKPFVEENGIIYPILIGNQKTADAYGGIRGIPTTFVIDKKGRIVEKFVGYRDKEVFESIIKEMIR